MSGIIKRFCSCIRIHGRAVVFYMYSILIRKRRTPTLFFTKNGNLSSLWTDLGVRVDGYPCWNFVDVTPISSWHIVTFYPKTSFLRVKTQSRRSMRLLSQRPLLVISPPFLECGHRCPWYGFRRALFSLLPCTAGAATGAGLWQLWSSIGVFGTCDVPGNRVA